MTIIVFGSINMDLVVRAPRLPAPGETLSGTAFATAHGGKGANQAVACARLGVTTRMIGRVGGDVFGTALRDSLSQQNVDVNRVRIDGGQASGVALITVDDRAENTIVIVPGANGAVGFDDVARLDPLLSDSSLLLLQLEIPIETVVAAAGVAHDHGLTVMLDPAPARPLPPELYGLVDILTPNETEAAILTGMTLDSDAALETAAALLQGRGARNVIIKLGSRGAFVLAAGARHGEFRAAYKVAAVDTVAAGDAFNGGLAAALAEKRPFDEAVDWGLAAGAISVTRAGAQASMPSRVEVLELLGRR